MCVYGTTGIISFGPIGDEKRIGYIVKHENENMVNMHSLVRGPLSKVFVSIFSFLSLALWYVIIPLVTALFCFTLTFVPALLITQTILPAHIFNSLRYAIISVYVLIALFLIPTIYVRLIRNTLDSNYTISPPSQVTTISTIYRTKLKN